MEEKGLTTIDFNSPKVVETLKKTVAVGATDDEFFMFAEMCKSTGLNPFKKELWFIKTKGYTRRDGTAVEGKVQMMTGINGYLAIANRHPQYDGLEVDYEWEGKQLKAAIAKVYRKDRRFPSTGYALMAEFKGGTPIWNEKPTVMLAKVAKSIALREAFPQEMNGLYTEEEMPPQYSAQAQVLPADQVRSNPKVFQRPELPERFKEPVNEETGEVTEEKDFKFEYSIPEELTPSAKKALWKLIQQKGAVVEGTLIKSPVALPGLEDSLVSAPDDDRPDWLDKKTEAGEVRE